MKKSLLASTLIAATALAVPAFAAEEEAITWTGGDSGTNWNTSANWDSSWTEGGNAAFDNTATNRTVTVDGEIIAGNITVSIPSGTGYTFNYSDGGSLTAESLTVSSSTENKNYETLTITGGTTNIGTLTVTDNNAELVVTGGTLTVENLSLEGYLTISGGVVVVTGSATLSESTGVLDMTGGYLVLGCAIVGDNGDEQVEISSGAKIILSADFLADAAASGEATVVISHVEEITFGYATLSDGDVTDIVSSFFGTEVDGYDLEWSFVTEYEQDQYFGYGSLYVTVTPTSTPEPSMFGLLFGLGAIGLVAARRRRRA